MRTDLDTLVEHNGTGTLWNITGQALFENNNASNENNITGQALFENNNASNEKIGDFRK